MKLWRPKPWRKLARKFLGPLLPASCQQAASWLGHRPRLRLGFATILERKDNGIYLRHEGKLVRGWSEPQEC